MSDPLDPVDDQRRFFGTSASAPNVAAVALLVLQAVPDLPPSRVYKILEETAIDMNEKGFDYDSGHGFVNALAAIRKAMLENGDNVNNNVGNDDSSKKKKKSKSDKCDDNVSSIPLTQSECTFVDTTWTALDIPVGTSSYGGGENNKKKTKNHKASRTM